tara:strand:- start:715 stop:948 length:234 start_codon:yes stop_codon:yes gene_type:complete
LWLIINNLFSLLDMDWEIFPDTTIGRFQASSSLRFLDSRDNDVSPTTIEKEKAITISFQMYLFFQKTTECVMEGASQ